MIVEEDVENGYDSCSTTASGFILFIIHFYKFIFST